MKLLLESLLYENNYRLNQDDVFLHLLSHPDYPSMKSITDTLDYFKIENAAFQVDAALLTQLPKVFITETQKNDYFETILVKKNKHSIKVLNENGKYTTTSIERFKNIWGGKVIAVEPLPFSLSKITSTRLIPLSLVVFVLCFQLFDYNFFALVSTVILLVCFAITLLTMSARHSEMQPAFNKVCKTITGNNNCLAVAKDMRAQIFGRFDLSDLSGVLLSSLLVMQFIAGWNPLLGLVITVFTVPVIFYSLYLQHFVLKKWCLLCLAISGLLIMYSAICAIALIYEYQRFQLLYFLKFGFVMSGVAYLWYVIGNLSKKNDELSKSERAYLQFKRNAETFSILHSNEPKITMLSENAAQITFGNTNAEIVIQAITNPLCGFWQGAFYQYKKLLANGQSLFKVNFIFNVATREDSNAWLISNLMIAIYKQEGAAKCWNAIDEWFESRNLDAWLSKYKQTAILTDETLSHNQWCADNKIYHTPATVLDGHLYPRMYMVSDFELLAVDYLTNEASCKMIFLRIDTKPKCH